MRKKAFRSDFEAIGIGPCEEKEIEIRYRKIRNPISCQRCAKDLQDFTEQLKVLEDMNQILKRMLDREVRRRPSAQDLKIIWQKWES
jgi:hypothetical protein